MPVTGTVPPKRESREFTGERFMVPPDLYYVELVDVDEADNTGRPAEWGNSWKWRFKVSDKAGRIITSNTMGPDGKPQPLLMIQYTSDKMGVSPAGVKATGRQWFEALIRRPLEDNDDLALISSEAIGQVARALVTYKTAKSTGAQFCAIGQMLEAEEEVVAKHREHKALTVTDEVPF